MSTGKQKKYIRHPDKYIWYPDKPFVSAFLQGFNHRDSWGIFISVIFTEIPPGSSFGGKNQFFFNHDLQKWKTLAYYKTQSSGRSSVVEHHVANVMVEGSNPFTRSIFFHYFPNHQNGTFVPFHRKNPCCWKTGWESAGISKQYFNFSIAQLRHAAAIFETT